MRLRSSLGRVLLLLAALALVASTSACSPGPSDGALLSMATSPEAKAARATAEQRIRERIDRLAAIDGLEPVATRIVDRCNRRPSRSVFDADRPDYDLRCEMTAAAYFGVRGEIADVLRRIRAARLTRWGGVDDAPTTGGTVAYALAYLSRRGRYPDGRLMPAPELRTDVVESPSMVLDWDRSDAEHPRLLTAPAPCPPRDVYLRCLSTPDPLPDLDEARARYATILGLALGDQTSSGVYFTVPRV